jgi:hypothetical protein
MTKSVAKHAYKRKVVKDLPFKGKLPMSVINKIIKELRQRRLGECNGDSAKK